MKKAVRYSLPEGAKESVEVLSGARSYCQWRHPRFTSGLDAFRHSAQDHLQERALTSSMIFQVLSQNLQDHMDYMQTYKVATEEDTFGISPSGD